METYTLERILKDRNAKLTFWLVVPVALSYLILQILLFVNQMNETQKQISIWREDQKNRIAQALFLQNDADLKEIIHLQEKKLNQSELPLQIEVWDKKRKLKANHSTLSKKEKMLELPQGMRVNFRQGEIIDVTSLYLGDKIQGYLVIHAFYDWKRLIRPSLLLLIACLAVFLILKFGVWLWVLTLRRSIVRPVERMTLEISPELIKFESLKPISLSEVDFKFAPIEFVKLVKSYNHLVSNIKILHEKENQFVAGAARVEVATQVAHDIRSPLAALLLAIEELPPLPGKQKEIFLGVLMRINEIGEELLTSRKKEGESVTNSSIEPSCGSINLKPLVSAIVDEKRILLSGNLEIQLIVPEVPEVKVVAEESDLKRALSNLIDNAIEALEGWGEIRLKFTETDGKVSLLVKDSGKGIPKEQFDRVWEPGVSFGKKNGNGLGLSFVKSVVESWGGLVALDSDLNKGTVVSIQLRVTDTESKE